MVDREGSVSVEATGASVEEAIAEGLARLGLKRDDVEIEIVNEASRGVFGLGSRDACVRLIPKPPAEGAAPEGAPAADMVEAAPREIAEAITWEEAAPKDEAPPIEAELDGEAVRAVIQELLTLMGVEDAQIDVRQSEPAEGETDPPLLLDVKAPTDALIGPRGETLTALQHITRLIVGHERGGRARLVVDVNGYKVRRARTLRRLAQRLAKQAIETDRTVVLEPMSPYERRIVHLELRDHPEVTTQSIGEGDRRKVTIIPRFLKL